MTVVVPLRPRRLSGPCRSSCGRSRRRSTGSTARRRALASARRRSPAPSASATPSCRATSNGDGRTDILAINGTDLVWFQGTHLGEATSSWAPGATTPDNVTIAPHDIDGDGRLDVALGAGWSGAEHRHLAVGQAERTRRHSGLGGVPHLRGADAAPDPVGGRRRRPEAGAGRGASARKRSQGAGLGRAERAAPGASGRRRIRAPTRGRWRWPPRPATSSTTSWPLNLDTGRAG